MYYEHYGFIKNLVVFIIVGVLKYLAKFSQVSQKKSGKNGFKKKQKILKNIRKKRFFKIC